MKFRGRLWLPGLSTTLVVGLIQFSRALNSVKNSFDILLLDHSLEVLSTVHTAKTCIDKGELLA